MKDLWLGAYDYEDILNEKEFELLEEMLCDDYSWHGVKSYFYTRSTNLVTDEDGYPIFDIYRIISPSMFLLFTKRKDHILLKNKRGELIELIWCE